MRDSESLVAFQDKVVDLRVKFFTKRNKKERSILNFVRMGVVALHRQRK